jgi:RNA polymerase sigma-70 factor (ECF subfamily)
LGHILLCQFEATSMTTSLAESFLEAVVAPVRDQLAPHRADLERWLTERLAAATQAWPQLALDAALFCRYVAARLPAQTTSLDALEPLRTDELYLACGCHRGDAEAHGAFEQAYFSGVVASLSRMRLDVGVVDDLKQLLRRQLFWGDGTTEPRIGLYHGRGDLGSWLRVMAVRAALKLLRSDGRELAAEDEKLAELSAKDGDAELAYLQRLYRGEVRAALVEALSGLGAREKNLIKQYYLDGLTVELIGTLYGAHRATVTRWLASIRQRLLDQTRQALMERMRVSQPECESIIRLVQGQLELTLNGLLRNS